MKLIDQIEPFIDTSQVRKTETIWNDLNPDWKLLYIPTRELCDDNFDMRLQVRFHR